jgi:hypothetical protein
VEVAERFADGGATSAELQAAFPASGRKPLTFLEDHPDAQGDTVIAMVQSTTEAKPYSAAFNMTAYPLPLAGHRGASAEGEAIICDLLRDVFGNPFREVKFDKRWKTDTAVSLAKQMYESREFGTMPILADALQDAGCDSDDILSHCRDAKQVHVRGCWVVDLVLGKS